MFHRYMHEAFHQNLMETLEHSSRPMHICWINPLVFRPSCSLSSVLGQTEVSPLGRSLVVASPKHMARRPSPRPHRPKMPQLGCSCRQAWTFDPGLLRLPVDPLSAYIFHDTTPPAFEPLLRAGRVVEWRVYGPDGNFPYLESLLFVRSSLARGGLEGSGCAGQFLCRDLPSREYISPWATPLTPNAIVRNSLREVSLDGVRSGTVHFIGSVWHGNEKLFRSFATGCQRAGIALHRHGADPLPAHLLPLVASDDIRNVPSDERDALMRASAFAIAVQGGSHLMRRGKALGVRSYIADRPMLAASMGLLVASNNAALTALLSDYPDSVAFHENASELCRVGAEVAERRLREEGARREEGTKSRGSQVARHMADAHTYVSRFADLTDMLLRATVPPLTTLGRATSVPARHAAAAGLPWCAAEGEWTRKLVKPLAPLNLEGLPTTFLIGAQMAGVYDLVEFMTERLGYCGVNTNFFEFGEMGDDDDVARYRSCYKHCNGKPALDLTPEYMYAHSTVAPRLAAPYVSARVLDGVRTIALVREPVTRFAAALDLELERCDGLIDDTQGRCKICHATKRWSNHEEATMHRKELCRAMRSGSLMQLLSEATRSGINRCATSWNLACQAVDYGLYAKQLTTWLHMLPKERMLVLHFEDFVDDRQENRRRAYDSLHRFLNTRMPAFDTDFIGANERPGRYLGRLIECVVRQFFEEPNADLVSLLRKTWPEQAPFASEKYNDGLANGRCNGTDRSADQWSLPWRESLEMMRRRQQQRRASVNTGVR